MPDRVEDPVKCLLVANPFSQTQETEASRAVGMSGRSFLQHIFLISSASYHRGSHLNLLEFLSYSHLFFENTSIANF
jgi:hypothetical protein